ncbi:hypothetical protein BDY19DRAFT_977431 [Irpex rosettiformis]|uniref:Uncharacterized protein n=1 Tax=Irpex rosettiformis TaxID=378272 RepID=A0ACB8TNN3_9APHY|nr:hypothetical protein BDY19DRAFT_977431 [Irpex rosettiformis]
MVRGQSWMLLNLDSFWVTGASEFSKEVRFGNRVPMDISHFAIPAWSESSIKSLCRTYPRIKHRSTNPESKLLRLPNELLLMIFDHTAGLADAVCLCLADGRMFAIGFSRVVELQKSEYANWAGKRVIFLGEHTEHDDFPASVQDTINYCLKNAHGTKRIQTVIHTLSPGTLSVSSSPNLNRVSIPCCTFGKMTSMKNSGRTDGHTRRW